MRVYATIRTLTCFDVLPKHKTHAVPMKDSRGEPPCTFLDETIGLPLVMSLFPKTYEFPGEAVLSRSAEVI